MGFVMLEGFSYLRSECHNMYALHAFNVNFFTLIIVLFGVIFPSMSATHGEVSPC